MDTIINLDEAYCDGKLGHKERGQCMHIQNSCTKKNISWSGVAVFNMKHAWNIMIDGYSLNHLNFLFSVLHCCEQCWPDSALQWIAWWPSGLGGGPRRMALVFHDEISCRVTDRLPIYLNSPQTSEISSWCSNDFLGKTHSFCNNYLWAHSHFQ